VKFAAGRRQPRVADDRAYEGPAEGRIEEGIGQLAGDEETQARGVADRLKGDSQRAG